MPLAMDQICTEREAGPLCISLHQTQLGKLEKRELLRVGLDDLV